nr:hypothetical protein [Tanacetum cinerariifolium]GEY52048.1 hypothetical protein [Tanacetum cinerariifolium]
VNTPQSGEDSLKLTELIELCTKLQQRVLDLETTKTNKAMEIVSLKRRVKKLERRKKSRTYKLKRLYKVGLSARVESSEDEGLVSTQDEQMFDADQDLDGEEEEVTEGSSKRAGTELGQESAKKQKIDDDKETAELKQLVNIIPDEEGVEIDAIPLAVKPQSIVDWKIQKEGKKSYYKIIKADRRSKIYLIFSHMLKDFDREYVETLWKLVKAKYGSTRTKGDYERVLWGDLKVMFEPHIEDEVWKMQQRYIVLRWTLFNSCGVRCLSL